MFLTHSQFCLLSLRVTAIEMVTSLAQSQHGRQYLAQQGIMDKISNMIVAADSDPFSSFYLPGSVRVCVFLYLFPQLFITFYVYCLLTQDSVDLTTQVWYLICDSLVDAMLLLLTNTGLLPIYYLLTTYRNVCLSDVH